jgi:hypothetical protein
MSLHEFWFHANKFAFEACILDWVIVELALAHPEWIQAFRANGEFDC